MIAERLEPGEVPVVYLCDSIDIQNFCQVKEEVMRLFWQGCYHVYLDFSHVEFLDSTGLGRLLLMQKKFEDRQGRLEFVNVSCPHIRRLFQMINLA